MQLWHKPAEMIDDWGGLGGGGGGLGSGGLGGGGL
jgi:hypothetical protein